MGPANLATVSALAGGVAKAPPGSLGAVVQHLDDQGCCLMLLALNSACRQGVPVSCLLGHSWAGGFHAHRVGKDGVCPSWSVSPSLA